MKITNDQLQKKTRGAKGKKPATMRAKIITIKKLTASAKKRGNGGQIKKNKTPMEMALYKNVKIQAKKKLEK